MARADAWSAGLFFVGLLLAGCTGHSDPGSRPAALVADAGKGGIEGLVVDDQARPLASVDVAIVALSLHVATDEQGRYLIPSLAPGSYLVEARLLGHRTDVATVTARAGVVATAPALVLGVLPTTQPYAVTSSKAGIFGCGIGWRPTFWYSGVAVCGFLTDVPLDTTHVDRFLVPWLVEGPLPGWTGSVFEMEWTSTQPFGHGLSFRFDVDGCLNQPRGGLGAASGRSPLRIDADADTVRAASSAGCARQCEADACSVVSRVFAASDTFGTPVDAGMSAEQPFHQYSTAFFHAGPAPDFSALA